MEPLFPHPVLAFLRSQLETDLLQLVEIGVDPAPFRARLQGLAARGSADALLEFQQELWSLRSPPGFPYEEPSDEASLRRWLPEEETEPFRGGPSTLRDRIAGGWLGRAAGCCLGKPLEIFLDRRQVETLCRALDSWPLRDYLNPWPAAGFPDLLPGRKVVPSHPRCARGRIRWAENDDDLNYPIATLICLERHGPGWTADQLFRLIADLTPWGQLWSSGKNGARAALLGLESPAGAMFGNPTRQSLGAMIRCDTWAWISPGNLRGAAEFALRDALYTQTRNGLYAGVFWAVALADALTRGDPVAALTAARATVPPKSKFAEMFDRAAALRPTASWEEAVDEMYGRYGFNDTLPENMRFNHSLINSALTVLAVLYGGGDFSATVGLAVAGGRDTDCNGATAGSLLGCALGRRALPRHLIEPLRNRYRGDMAGCHELRFTDLADRTFTQALSLGRFAPRAARRPARPAARATPQEALP